MTSYFLQGNDAASPCSARTRSTSAREAGNRDVWDAAKGRAAGRTGAGARSLGGGNQLQKFLRVIEPLLGLGTEGLDSELCRHGILTGYRIGGHELDFVDAVEILVIAERFADCLAKSCALEAPMAKARTSRVKSSRSS